MLTTPANTPSVLHMDSKFKEACVSVPADRLHGCICMNIYPEDVKSETFRDERRDHGPRTPARFLFVCTCLCFKMNRLQTTGFKLDLKI